MVNINMYMVSYSKDPNLAVYTLYYNCVNQLLNAVGF
jgi:hypothetical protein